MNGPAFLACFEPVLTPTLRDGNMVKHLRASMTPATRKAVETTGAELCFSAPYSLDLNSIKLAFSQIKVRLKKADARTVTDLSQAIRGAIDVITPADGHAR